MILFLWETMGLKTCRTELRMSGKDSHSQTNVEKGKGMVKQQYVRCFHVTCDLFYLPSTSDNEMQAVDMFYILSWGVDKLNHLVQSASISQDFVLSFVCFLKPRPTLLQMSFALSKYCNKGITALGSTLFSISGFENKLLIAEITLC